MTYTALEVNKATQCWMVRRYQSDNVDEQKGLVDGRSMRNSDYVEAELWGAETAAQAIEMAKKREGWA